MFTKIRVTDHQRAIVTRNDRFARLLMPGVHRLFNSPISRIGVEYYELRVPLFRSKWSGFLLDQRPDLIAQHFVAVRTGTLEIAMISVNGALTELLLPGKFALFWKDAGTISVNLVDIGTREDATESMPSLFETARLHGVEDETSDDWTYEILEES
jgi:hypothetical protein